MTIIPQEKIEDLFAFAHNKHQNKWISLWQVIAIYIGMGQQDKFDFSEPTAKKQFEFMLNRYGGKKLVGVTIQVKEGKYRFVAGASLCPICKIKMELRVTMSGDQWICENYNICGGRMTLEEAKNV